MEKFYVNIVSTDYSETSTVCECQTEEIAIVIATALFSKNVQSKSVFGGNLKHFVVQHDGDIIWDSQDEFANDVPEIS